MTDNPDELTLSDRTQGEICALTPDAVYVREANAALRQIQGKNARWWSYSVSHCYFEVVIGSPLGEDNVVLGLGACEHAAGPIEWSPQQIEVIVQHDSGDPHRSPVYTLQDVSVKFCAVGRLFRWKRNYDIWAHHHLPLYARGPGSSARKGLEEMLESLGQPLRAYYSGQINFGELENQVQSLLWHGLPVVKNGGDGSK